MDASLQEIFASNLIDFMQLRGVSQVDMMAKFGVASSTVSDWCSGKKFPRADRIQQIADLLDVEVSELMSQSGKQSVAKRDRDKLVAANPDVQLIIQLALELDAEDRKLIIDVMHRLVAGPSQI